MREVDFDRYEDWIDQGKSFAELRKDLIANGIPPEDVSDVLKSIDNHITTKKIIKLKQSRGKQWIFAGVLLSSVSIPVFVFGFFPLAIMGLVGLASGIGMVFFGWHEFNHKAQKIFESGSRRFRRGI